MRNVLIFIFLLLAGNLFSQELRKCNIPEIALKTTNGELFLSSEFAKLDSGFILCFWKSCCHNQNKALDAINEDYSEWMESTGLQIFVISTDDSKASFRVKPFVEARGWEFTILLDVNSDFKRAMNVSTEPNIMLFDKNCSIIWQKSLFLEKDLEELKAKIVKLNTN